MIRFFKFFVLIFMLLYCGVVPGWSQGRDASKDQTNPKTLLAQGVRAYNRAEFDQARNLFDRLVNQGSGNRLYTISLLLRAHSDYQAGNNQAAQRTLKQLLSEVPKSRYAENAHYLLGQIAFKEQEFVDAASEFIWVMDFGEIPALKRQAADHAEILFDDYLTSADLRRRLRRDYLGEDGLALVAHKLARSELEQGNRSNGEKIITDYLQKHQNTIFRDKLMAWDKIDTKAGDRLVRIGVILPLTGVDNVDGRALQNGILYAERAEQGGRTDGLASASRSRIAAPAVEYEFVIRDSESNIVGALKAAQLLLKDASIKALIGEFDGAASSAIAALAQERQVPILIPVANQNTMTSIGDYVFQLNADRDQKGRALADYAFQYLNCRTFATIAPQDNYGQQMVDGLSAAVDRLGGEILSQKWYYEGAQDLARQFKAIREVALRRSYEDSVKLGKLAVRSGSPASWPRRGFRPDLVDDLSVPVTNISAIFLPLYEEDIRLIANQRAYYNIQAITLGGDYWQNLEMEARRELQPYIDGAIIASDYYVDWNTENGRRFRDDFRRQMGVTPSRHEILGYDAASLLINCINKNARSAREIRDALAAVKGYVGMKGEISFDETTRVNRMVNILRFSGVNLTRVR